jgi:nucleotide-binding universal stress UspA family protein
MSEERCVLLAVRIGEASLAPARTAAWLARELGARVTMIYVAEELLTAAAVAAGAGVDPSAVRDRMLTEARTRAEGLGREVMEGIQYDVIVAEGDVAEEVAAAADRLGADLLVAGSRARGAVRSVFLGDTTRDLLRRAHCPVVVVPPGVG